jgi:membrane dipeptidase
MLKINGRTALLAAASVLALGACSTLATIGGGPAVEGVSAEAMAIHQRMLTLDTHLDTPALLDGPRGYDITKRHSVDREGSQIDLPRMNEGGLDGGFWAIYMGQGPLTADGYAKIRDTALIRATSIHKMVAANPGKFEIALKAADAERINKSGKKIVFLSIENSYELGDDITMMDTFYKLGVRLIGPVHNGNNQLADSANMNGQPAKWNGLSPMGKAFVKRANELGMMLDGSHSADTTLEQMIDLSATPIVMSHHGFDGPNEHPRNISDALAKKLAAKGGVIQMNTLFLKTLPAPAAERGAKLSEIRTKYGEVGALTEEKYQAYLDEVEAVNKQYPSPQADFEDYMKQILYGIKLVGVDHIGLGGADWDGGGGLTGYEDISYMPKVTARLLKEGYSETDLQKMWSGNVLRVMKAAEDYAASVKK